MNCYVLKKTRKHRSFLHQLGLVCLNKNLARSSILLDLFQISFLFHMGKKLNMTRFGNYMMHRHSIQLMKCVNGLILYNQSAPTPSDFGEKRSLIDIYFIANDVTKIQKGAYFFNRKDNSIDLLKANIRRDVSG